MWFQRHEDKAWQIALALHSEAKSTNLAKIATQLVVLGNAIDLFQMHTSDDRKDVTHDVYEIVDYVKSINALGINLKFFSKIIGNSYDIWLEFGEPVVAKTWAVKHG